LKHQLFQNSNILWCLDLLLGRQFPSCEETYCLKIHGQTNLENLYIPLLKQTTIVNRTHAFLHKSVFVNDHRLMQNFSALITATIRYYHSEIPWGKMLSHKHQVGTKARFSTSQNIPITMTAKTWMKCFVKNIIKNVASASAYSCTLESVFWAVPSPFINFNRNTGILLSKLLHRKYTRILRGKYFIRSAKYFTNLLAIFIITLFVLETINLNWKFL